MTDEVPPGDGPDFQDDRPISAPMQVFLHLEKVQTGEEPFSNLCAAYTLLFGVEPVLSRPSQEIFDEIQVALSAMGPSFVKPTDDPKAPHRSLIDPPERGPVANAVGLAGHSTVWRPVPAQLMVPGVADAAHIPVQADVVPLRRRSGCSTAFLVLAAYMVGVSRGADSWGGWGRACLWALVVLVSITVIGSVQDRRKSKTDTSKENT